MDRDRYQRIKDLFIEASEVDGEERQRLLNTASAEDRQAVLKMLESGTLTFLDKSPVASSSRDVSRDAVESLRAGQRFGRYEISKELGSGGGGRVYLAMDTNLRRQVAIKTLGAYSAGTERRFAREAETASALNHPNIVTVYEAASEAGTSYIAMEYISGGTLRSYIPKKNGMATPKFFDWSIQICDALAAAHRAGLIHRDLKPGNIMITDRGVPKIVDFGLAKPAFENSEDTLTGAGMAVGTAGYMAPEQAAGKDVDARADIFSLGCVLYEMVSGRRAFQGNSQIELLAATIHTEPESLTATPAQIPADLARIIHLCMRKDPALRLQSAADIRLMLEELRLNLGTQQEVAAVADSGSRWKIAVGALVAGALLTSASYWYWDSRRKPAPRPHPITTMLTTDSGLSSQPALSSDGRLLFYASDRGGDGNLDIWMQQIGGGAPVRLTSGPEDESTPDVSHDATRIVFRSEKDGGGIYTMPVLGGEPMLLAQGGRNPKFSPDGQYIAYWTGRENAALLPGAASVFVIPIGGGEPRHVSSSMSATMYPVWSPGGDELLMVGRRDPDSKREPSPDWWILPLEPGRHCEPLANRNRLENPKGFRYSRAGLGGSSARNRGCVCEDTVGGSSGVFISLRSLRFVGHSSRLLERNAGGNSDQARDRQRVLRTVPFHFSRWIDACLHDLSRKRTLALHSGYRIRQGDDHLHRPSGYTPDLGRRKVGCIQRREERCGANPHEGRRDAEALHSLRRADRCGCNRRADPARVA